MESTALSKLNQEQMLARVNQAKWPKDLTTDQRNAIARVAIEYGLDPLMRELMIYGGSPYVCITGRRRKAQETGLLDGISSRPATKDERDARGALDGDYLYTAEVRVKGAGYPFVGWGKVTKAEVDRAKALLQAHGSDEWSLPIVRDPADIAEKRAEAEALARAFHLPLPSFESITASAPTVRTIQPPEPPAATSKPAAPNGKPRRDPESIRDKIELFQAAYEDLGIQPDKVCERLGVKRIQEWTKTPAEAYRIIAGG